MEDRIEKSKELWNSMEKPERVLFLDEFIGANDLYNLGMVDYMTGRFENIEADWYSLPIEIQVGIENSF